MKSYIRYAITDKLRIDTDSIEQEIYVAFGKHQEAKTSKK